MRRIVLLLVVVAIIVASLSLSASAAFARAAGDPPLCPFLTGTFTALEHGAEPQGPPIFCINECACY